MLNRKDTAFGSEGNNFNKKSNVFLRKDNTLLVQGNGLCRSDLFAACAELHPPVINPIAIGVAVVKSNQFLNGH